MHQLHQLQQLGKFDRGRPGGDGDSSRRRPSPNGSDDGAENRLLTIVEEARGRQAHEASWRIESSADPSEFWIRVEHRGARTPDHGWKLHLSATICSAETVLRQALPVLLAEDASFKLAASLDQLGSLNEGEGGLSQIGKFITVYPNDDPQAIRLAVALDEATRGLPGPAIPSDRPLRPGSLVHYRYGGIGDLHVQTPPGEILPAIRTPDGQLVPDRRTTSYQPPEWAVDPFLAAGVAEELPSSNPLIAGRYLLVSPLSRSARGAVYLAADIQEGRCCVLKRAFRDALVSTDGQDARDRLRHEAWVLTRLGPDPRLPAVYDLVEQEGDLFLVMEDVEGETLEEHVGRLLSSGRWPSGEQVIAWGRELAALLSALHDHGFVYRDLKSSNVIVAPDGHIRLIDFELAHQLGGSRAPYGRGTRGYMSPQAWAAEPPTVTDDVYGLGALLYFLASGAEPSQAPAPFALLDRPIDLLNPSIGPTLIRVIARCLDQDPARRFGSMAEVESALADVGAAAEVTPPPFGGESMVESLPAARRRYRQLAQQLGDALCSVAQQAPDEGGRFWVSTHETGRGLSSRDLCSGSAGALLALAELVAELDDPLHRAVLVDGARWLADSRPIDRPLPGLYVGEAGVAAALLRAGQVLGDPQLIGRAAERGRLIASLPYASPDLYNGTAGRLRCHLLLWDETGHPEHLAAAITAGEALLATAEEGTPGELRWTIPPGYDGLSGRAYLGYAHGAAGIADALLDLFEASGEQRFLAAAEAAGRWLAGLAIPIFEDESGLDWPDEEGEGRGPAGGLWCHGAAGIGRFFVHLAEQDALPEAAELATRAARAVARATRRLGPTQCHGLAGNLELLLDMFQSTAEGAYLAEARSLGRLLEAFAQKRDGLLLWSSESPETVTPDYAVGYAGVAVCLLRLSDPERLPHQLSRRGFRRQGPGPDGGAPGGPAAGSGWPDQAAQEADQQPLGEREQAWPETMRRGPSGGAALGAFVRQLGPLFRPYWRRQAEAVGYMLFELAYGLALPLASMVLVDQVIPSGSAQLLGSFILGLLIVYGLDAFVGMRRAYVTEWINERILLDLRQRVFEHLQRLPHAFFAEARVGDLMARLFGDLDVVSQALGQLAGVGLFLALRALVTAVALVSLSPLLGGLVLAVVPLFGLGYLALQRRLERASYALQTVHGDLEAFTQENLSAHATVKAFGLERRAVASFKARLEARFGASLQLTVLFALFETSMSLAVTLGELVVLGTGGYLVMQGQLSVGTLLAFIGLLAALFQPIALLSSAGQSLQKASGALDRLAELIDAPPAIADRPGARPLPPLARDVRLEQVSFGYQPDRPVLRDLDLTIPAGSHVAIVGPSGGGKTSLVQLLLRFFDPASGAILFDGHDLRTLQLDSVRRQIAVVFQDTFVFDTTLRENIALSRPGATDAEVFAAAQAAKLHDYILSLPTGYDTLAGERGVRLSGGQRQRLALARALLRNPSLLILDEPTSALDAQTEREILDTLAELGHARTTISITHRLSLAATADWIFVLADGRLVEQGPHAELVRAGRLYQRLYEEQIQTPSTGSRR